MAVLKQHTSDTAVVDFSMRALTVLAGEEHTASSLIRSGAVSTVRDALLSQGGDEGHDGDGRVGDEAGSGRVERMMDDLDVQDQGCRLLEALALNGRGNVDMLQQGAMSLLLAVLRKRGDSDGRVKQQCCAAISGMLNTLPPHLPYVSSVGGACLSVMQDASRQGGSRPEATGPHAQESSGAAAGAGSRCGEVEGRYLVNALSDAVRSHPYEV